MAEDKSQSAPFWTKNYSQGVPATLDLGENTYIENINDCLEKFAEKPALECLGVEWTYKRLDDDSAKMASALQDMGLEKGARIAIMMPTIPQYLITLIGAMRGGFIPVGVNPLYTPRELEHQLNDSGADVVFILENFASTLEEALPHTNVKHVVVTHIGDIFGGAKGAVANFLLKRVRREIPAWKIDDYLHFSDFLESGKGKAYTPQDHKPEDIAVLQYTGGTTGVSKGAMLTQRNVLAAGMASTAWNKPAMNASPEIEDPIFLLPLPLYHIFTLYISAMGLFSGAKCVLIPNPRDINGLIKTMRKTPFNLMIGLNTLYQAILNNENVGSIDFSHARVFIAGGTATHQSVADGWRDLTKKPILEGWGMTETTGAGTCNPYPLEKFNGTIGLPMPSILIAIRDDEGNDLDPCETGEIWIKGPNVMVGYWQNEEATKNSFDDDGYLATGDIGLMDEKGYVTIVDRKKDMILVSGFNVFSNEIENVVSACEGVAEVAAIGVPDERSGEAVKIFVVRGSDTLTKEKILAHCEEELTGYKRPKHIEFIDELPKSPVGKVLRKDLRDN